MNLSLCEYAHISEFANVFVYRVTKWSSFHVNDDDCFTNFLDLKRNLIECLLGKFCESELISRPHETKSMAMPDTSQFIIKYLPFHYNLQVVMTNYRKIWVHNIFSKSPLHCCSIPISGCCVSLKVMSNVNPIKLFMELYYELKVQSTLMCVCSNSLANFFFPLF